MKGKEQETLYCVLVYEITCVKKIGAHTHIQTPVYIYVYLYVHYLEGNAHIHSWRIEQPAVQGCKGNF